MKVRVSEVALACRASIFARMLTKGEIAACGPLDTLTRVSDTLFLSELANAA